MVGELMGDTKFRQTGRKTAKGPFRHEIRDIRRKESEERSLLWASLSTKEKLAQLDQRPGASAKQRKRLAQ